MVCCSAETTRSYLRCGTHVYRVSAASARRGAPAGRCGSPVCPRPPGHRTSLLAILSRFEHVLTGCQYRRKPSTMTHLTSSPFARDSSSMRSKLAFHFWKTESSIGISFCSFRWSCETCSGGITPVRLTYTSSMTCHPDARETCSPLLVL